MVPCALPARSAPMCVKLALSCWASSIETPARAEAARAMETPSAAAAMTMQIRNGPSRQVFLKGIITRPHDERPDDARKAGHDRVEVLATDPCLVLCSILM